MKWLSFHIAFRYLLSKKSVNVINIITLVSIGAVMVVSAAMLVLFSAFNGFDNLVKSLYGEFSPDLIIRPAVGKVFNPDSTFYNKLNAEAEIIAFAGVLEENALLKYDNNEYIATIKGIPSNYPDVSGIDSAIVRGDFVLYEDGLNYAVLGAGVSSALSVSLNNSIEPIQVYLPKRGKQSISLDATRAFNRRSVRPGGVFSIQQEFDSKYVFLQLDLVRELLNYKTELTALEIATEPNADIDDLKNRLKEKLGSDYNILDRFEQNETLFKVMQTEKLAVYAIATLILIIAAFNIIGSLSMLVLEKKRDISILKAMGGTKTLIRNIFLLEGMLIAIIGSASGLTIGIILCVIQSQFGLIKLQGSGSFVVDHYPVVLRAGDVLLILLTVCTISFIAAWFPARKAARDTELILQK